MRASWHGLTIDCRDPDVLAKFWGALLGRQVSEDADLPGWRRLNSGNSDVPCINFQPVAEGKTAKVRMHLDVRVDDLDNAVDLVTSLGGRTTGERHDYDAGGVVVMADPEGNEFCLVEYYGQML